MSEHVLILLIAVPYLGAALVPLVARGSRSAAAWSAAAVMAACLMLLAPLAHEGFVGRTIIARITWLPEWGLDLAFRLDGLLDQVRSMMIERAEERGLVLRVQTDDGVPATLRGDVTRSASIAEAMTFSPRAWRSR